jgi:hypothetical protein
MTKTYLISITTLKTTYGFDDNIEDKYILPNILKCQDFIIRPLLGEIKWAEIISQVADNNVSVKNEELLKEYIQPVIAYYVRSEVVYDTAYKVKNAGVEDPASTSRFNELVRIANKYLTDSNHYQSLLKNWMLLYGGLVPDCKFEYKSGLFLGSSHKRDYDNLPNITL